MTITFWLWDFKGYWNRNIDDDIRKLMDFTEPNQDYDYNLGLSVILGKSIDETVFSVVKGGRIIA